MKRGPKVETLWEPDSGSVCYKQWCNKPLFRGVLKQHYIVAVTELSAWGQRHEYPPVLLTVSCTTRCIYPVSFISECLFTCFFFFIPIINVVWQMDLPSFSPLGLFMFKVLTPSRCCFLLYVSSELHSYITDRTDADPKVAVISLWPFK